LFYQIPKFSLSVTDKKKKKKGSLLIKNKKLLKICKILISCQKNGKEKNGTMPFATSQSPLKRKSCE
jgi:hypothetical protein